LNPLATVIPPVSAKNRDAMVIARGDHSILTRHRPAAADEPDHAGQHPAAQPRTTLGTPPGPPRPRRPPAHPEMPAVPASAAAGIPTPERQQRLHRPDGSPRASQSALAQRAARSYTNATGPGRRPTVMRHSWRDRVHCRPVAPHPGWARTGPQSGRNGGRPVRPGSRGGDDSPSSPSQRRRYWSGMSPQPK
jgi:hypothetical protein